jgi:hypothetical protein
MIRRGKRFFYFNLSYLFFGVSVMMPTFTLGRINDRLDNTVCHTKTYNTERIPEAPHENHMTRIPYPLKRKWKHILSPNPNKPEKSLHTFLLIDRI